METADKIKYWNWCADKYWQYQKRQEWAYAWHGDTLVRFHELAMPDPDFTEGLIAWLKTPESVHGFADGDDRYAGCTVYNRPAALSEEWKPVSAWYEQQEGQIDERTKLKVIRVYQALQRNPEEAGEDGPYVMEDGCMQKLSFTYYWKVAVLPMVPESESGVTYRLGGVSKDDETGLWSCYLEKRERVTQELAEYTSDNTGFAARTEQQYIGVKHADVADIGKEASAGGGVTVRRRVKKNEDCTSDVTIETIVDKPVEKSVEEIRKTLRGVRTKVTNRSMDKAAATDELKIGDVIRNEKTPSGLFDQSIETVAPIPVGLIEKTVQEGVLRKIEQTTENVVDEPEVEVENEKGFIRKKRKRATEEATWDLEETVDEAKASDAEKTWTTKDDSYEYTHGVKVYRNQKEVPTPPSDKYRCTMSLSINEYGLYDAIVNWTERNEISGGGGSAGLSNSGTEIKWIDYRRDGKHFKRPVYADYTVRVETGGNLHTIMLDGAESGFGFTSHDNGRIGVKYTNIRIGAEQAAI